MIKRIFLLSLLLLIASKGYCQKAIKFGVLIDPSVTWLSAESRSVKSEGALLGIKGGLIIDRYFQKNYAVQTGISIGKQGGKLSCTDTLFVNIENGRETIFPAATVNYYINYITIPVGLKLKTNEIGYFSYYARLGFTSQINIKANASSNDNKLNKDILDNEIRLYNLSYHFGIGVEYAFSKDTAFDFGLVYHNGFLDVTKNSNAKVFSRDISLRVGVIF